MTGKTIWTILRTCLLQASFFLGCSSLHADTMRVTGFEESDAVKVFRAQNCQIEIIKAEEGETIPDGKRYLKVTLGGVNGINGGAVVVNIPQDKVPDNAETISFWIKGSQENKFGPVLLIGDAWCWMGKRFEKKAQLDVEADQWTRFEFKLKDFVPGLDREFKQSKQLNRNKYLYIALGESKDYNDSIVFYIDKIEFEN